MKSKEIWKEYPLDFEFEGFYKIEVSNQGNIKTYNKMYPDGNILEGSKQSGYRILRSKLRKKWSEKDLEKIDNLNAEINEINIQIKEKKNKAPFEDQVAKLREDRDELIQKRKKLNTRLTKKYCINLAVLYHKAVADLFLEKPEGPEYQFVIHKDFDKTNNEVSNLAWATKEDLDERFKKHPKMILREFNKQFMEQVPQVKASKLKEMEVLRIKKRLKKGDSLNKLSKQFGVSDMQIHRIKTGENWSHVKLIEDIKKEK